jgi:AcrR family transcriptional regulator
MDSRSSLNPPSSSAAGALPTTYFRSDRERVLEAILRVAAAKGYEATTVADVIAAAGISRETFDELFESREACFLEAYEAAIDVAVAHVSVAFDGAAGQPWPARVEAALRALVELFAAESEIIRMAMVEVTAVGEEARIRYRSAIERFTPFLEEGRPTTPRAGEIPADTARFAIGGATSLIFDEVRAGRGPDLTRILPELVFAVLVPYLGAAAAEDELRDVRD